MSCHTGRTRKFLLQHFSKNWLYGPGEDGYVNARKKSMLEREKGKLQNTLVRIKTVMEPDRKRMVEVCEKMVQSARLDVRIAKMNFKLVEASLNLFKLPLGSRRSLSSVEEEKSCMAKKDEFVKRKVPLKAEIALLKKLSDSEEEKKVRLLLFCPSGDCRGMVDDEGSCVLCKTEVCLRCHSEKRTGEEHTCNEDDAKSVDALSKQSKPCPSCGSLISKISGCDQMWCPSCKSTFSWVSGAATQETIHNPHAVRWMRENDYLDRDPLDVPCGGFLEVKASPEMEAVLLSALKGTSMWERANQRQEGILCTRSTVHSFMELFYGLDAFIENLGHVAAEHEGILEDHRAEFCLGRTTEEEWKDAIFGAVGAAEYVTSTRSILISLRNLSVERFNLLASMGDTEFRPHPGVNVQEALNDMNFDELLGQLGAQMGEQGVQGLQGMLPGMNTQFGEFLAGRDIRDIVEQAMGVGLGLMNRTSPEPHAGLVGEQVWRMQGEGAGTEGQGEALTEVTLVVSAPEGPNHTPYELDVTKAAAELLALLSLTCEALRGDAEEKGIKEVSGINLSVSVDPSVGKPVLMMAWDKL